LFVHRNNHLTLSRKERELQEAESTSAANNRSLSQIQTQVQIAKQSLRTKKDELTRE
jgi:DNA repair protein RAD50